MALEEQNKFADLLSQKRYPNSNIISQAADLAKKHVYTGDESQVMVSVVYLLTLSHANCKADYINGLSMCYVEEKPNLTPEQCDEILAMDGLVEEYEDALDYVLELAECLLINDVEAVANHLLEDVEFTIDYKQAAA